MTDFLNSNSGVTAAIALIATVISLIIAGQSIRLAKKALKATFKPQIWVSLRPERFIGSIDYIDSQRICVENLGGGPAYKIRFGGDLNRTPTLNKIDFIKNGIETLPSRGKKESEKITVGSGGSYHFEGHPLFLLLLLIKTQKVMITIMTLLLILARVSMNEYSPPSAR